MKTPTKRVTCRLAASIAIATALATSSAWAAYVWTGAGNGYWLDSSNWQDGKNIGTGFFIRSGVNDASGNEIVVVSNDVHFDGNKSFGYNFYVDRGTSLEAPATLAADVDAYGLNCSKPLYVGTNGSTWGDGWLWIKNGTYSFSGVNLGQNAANPASSGYLTIGSPDRATTFTSGGAFNVYSGEVTAENAAVNINGDLQLAYYGNSTAKVDKVSGDWCVNGDIKMSGYSANGAPDTPVARFYHRGGEMIVTNNLYVQMSGSVGEFYMEGGHVTVSNIVRFGEWKVPSGGTANLYLNGGVFETKTFRFHNGDTGYVVLNGGTYKAMADGSIASTEGRVGAVKGLFFKVGERGGMIDTAGHDVVFPLRLLQDGSSTGGLFVKGGGSLTLENANVTYTGKTCIEAGTTLVVSNSTVKSNILSHGIELVGAPTVNTEYTIFRCGDDDTLTNDDLANVTCGVASDFTKAVGEGGKSIVVTVISLKPCCWTGAKDNNLSDPANWSDGIVPTSGNPVIQCAAGPLAVGGLFHPDTITIPEDSPVVTIGSGCLHVNTLTNACKLAIGAGASLEVDGDIVAKPSGYGKTAYFLDSNEGSVIVHGNAVGIGVSSVDVYEYATGGANTMPMQVGGIRYEAGGNTLYFHINSANSYHNQGPGSWVIGGNGIGFTSGREHAVTHFVTQYGGSVMFHSSADWTLANSMKNNANQGDMLVNGSGDITFDTSDYSDPTVSRTITLEGRLYANNVKLDHAAFIVDGCGTVVVDTADMSSVTGIDESLKHTCISNSVLQVKSGATLKVNAGKKITGANGRIALDAGATLALVSGGKDDFTSRIEPAVTLPAEGVAKIRIDGRRLRSGDHVIATVASGTTANVALDLASTALDGRKDSLSVVPDSEDPTKYNLVLNIQPTGLMIIFR